MAFKVNDVISYNKRFDIPRSNNSTFVKGDLLGLIQKYPMLWGWLLGMEPTDVYSETTGDAIKHALSNTYGVSDNPIKPDPSKVDEIEQKQGDITVRTDTSLNDKLVLAHLQSKGILRPTENLGSINWARDTLSEAYKYKTDAENYKKQADAYIKRLEKQVNYLNNELNISQNDSNALGVELKELQQKYNNIPPPPVYRNEFWNNPAQYYQSKKAEINTQMWLELHKDDWMNISRQKGLM